MMKFFFFLLCSSYIYGTASISWDFALQRIRDNPCGYSEQRVKNRELYLKKTERQFALEWERSQETLDPMVIKQCLRLPSFFIKKRYPEKPYNEMMAWEVGELLGLERYVVPSYVVFINEQVCTVQPKKELYSYEPLIDLNDLHRLMSLKDYWLGQILIYILGAGDITVRNIGCHVKDYHPIYYDLEDVFNDRVNFSMFLKNKGERLKYGINCPFYPLNLCGGLFFQPLGSQEVKCLNSYQENIKNNLLPQVLTYIEQNPYLSVIQKDAFLQRLDRILNVSFVEDLSFRDFMIELFPNLPESYSYYIEKICHLLGWGDIGFGGVLFWINHLDNDWRKDRLTYKKINRILDQLYDDLWEN